MMEGEGVCGERKGGVCGGVWVCGRGGGEEREDR